jgi:alpha/beta hydrolase family protein
MNRRRFQIVVVLSASLAAGCSTFRLDPKGSLTEDRFRSHVLMYDSRGEPLDPLTEGQASFQHLRAEDTPSTENAPETYDQYIQRILDGIEAHRSTQDDKHVKILFFIHGGLNTRVGSLQRAAEQIAAIAAPEEKNGNPAMYPIFINWQSSLVASYRDHLLHVTKGQDTYRAGLVLAPFKLGTDVARMALEIPPDNGLQFWDWRRRKTYVREGVVSPRDCQYEIDFREGEYKPPTSLLRRIRSNVGAFATYILFKWWTTGVIDGAGTPAWSSMNYTVDRLFYSDQEMHHPYDFKELETSGGGDLAHFLRRLAAALKPGDQVILAGHSAGAIVANAIITNFGETLPITTLVYMAPASTIDELMNGGRVASFLTARPGRELYILTLHEVTEFSERWHADLTPRGSLLVWLDEFIQPKHSEFRGQMMGRARNLRLHTHLIPCEVQKHIHITAFSDRPKSPTIFHPQKHGEVGDIRYWRPEAWRPADVSLKQICVSDDPHALRDPNLPAQAGTAPRCVANRVSP